MSQTPVYIVRHAESYASSINKFATQSSTFGDGGILPMKSITLPKDLGENPFIICSPKQRCLLTSLLIKPNGADLIDNNLDERNCGIYNNVTFKSKQEYIDAVKEIERFDQVGGEQRGWETCGNMLSRLLKTIDIARTIKDATSIILLTHWHPINVLINYFNNQFLGLHHDIKPFSFHKININADIIPVNTYIGLPFVGCKGENIDHEKMYETTKDFPSTYECYESEGILYAELTRRRIARPPKQISNFLDQSAAIGLKPFTHSMKFVSIIGAQQGYDLKDAPIQPYPEEELNENTKVQDANILSFGKGWNMSAAAYLVFTNDGDRIRRVATKLKQDRWTEIIHPIDELNNEPYSVTYTRIEVTD